MKLNLTTCCLSAPQFMIIILKISQIKHPCILLIMRLVRHSVILFYFHWELGHCIALANGKLVNIHYLFEISPFLSEGLVSLINPWLSVDPSEFLLSDHQWSYQRIYYLYILRIEVTSFLSLKFVIVTLKCILIASWFNLNNGLPF